MKKLLTIFLMLVFVVSFVAAKVNEKVEKPENNPHCSDIGDYDNELKIDPPVSGTYDGITFTLDDNLQYFDWSATFPIDAVIAKGGDNATVYYYNPAEMSDSGLVSPLNGGGQIPALSHAVFCWDDPEDVPEFGTLAAGAALIGALGIFAFNRRK